MVSPSWTSSSSGASHALCLQAVMAALPRDWHAAMVGHSAWWSQVDSCWSFRICSVFVGCFLLLMVVVTMLFTVGFFVFFFMVEFRLVVIIDRCWPLRAIIGHCRFCCSLLVYSCCLFLAAVSFSCFWCLLRVTAVLVRQVCLLAVIGYSCLLSVSARSCWFWSAMLSSRCLYRTVYCHCLSFLVAGCC